MKKLTDVFLLMLSMAAVAQNKQSATANKSVIDTSQQKKSEMKQYFFVMLTRGSRRNEITDTTVINKLQAGHMANITRLAEMGKIVVAGPFGDEGNWRGIFIFDAPTREEVEGYLKQDPAIAAGRLDYEIHPWWTAKNAVFK